MTHEFAEPKPDTRAWAQAFDTALDVRPRAQADLRSASARIQRSVDVAFHVDVPSSYDLGAL